MTTVQVPEELAAGAAEGSFRDPAGSLFFRDGRVLRAVYPAGFEAVDQFLKTEVARRLEQSGKLVATRLVESREAEPYCDGFPAGARIVEHPPIPFPSYPYEWPAEMLHAAGALTLELAESLLAEGFGLKDATPYNILFRGAAPVFVDLLSFERRRPRDPVWLAEAQFVRTFLLPLAAARRFGIEAGCWLGARRDGLDPEQAYAWLGALERLRNPWLTLVTLPAWLTGWTWPDARLYRPRQSGSAEKAAFILERLYRRLRTALASNAPKERLRSRWSDYMQDHAHYAGADFELKEAFVGSSLDRTQPGWVLDVGANTGHFSRLAAARGASVVAIDSDAAVAGACWKAAAASGSDILPLVVDIARPTPAIGWRNRECRSFLDRAKGRFDMVLMLAVVHHLLVTERVPLEGVLDLAADLTRRYVLIEYVDPADPMFGRLVRGREALHAGLTPEVFENACRRRFAILGRQPLDDSRRVLYLLGKTGGYNDVA